MSTDLVARPAVFFGKTLLPVELEADARANAANANFMVPTIAIAIGMNGDNSLRVQMFYRTVAGAEGFVIYCSGGR